MTSFDEEVCRLVTKAKSLPSDKILQLGSCKVEDGGPSPRAKQIILESCRYERRLGGGTLILVGLNTGRAAAGSQSRSR